MKHRLLALFLMLALLACLSPAALASVESVTVTQETGTAEDGTDWAEAYDDRAAEEPATAEESNAVTEETDTVAEETEALAEPVYYYDSVGLLTARQRAELEDSGAAIAQAYDFGVYVVVLADYRDYDRRSVEDAAETVYRELDLGVGAAKSGLMLLLSMDDRDYDLCAYGYGHTAFTDYGKAQLARGFLDDFRYDDWYAGFRDYQAEAEEMLRLAAEGSPVDDPYAGYGGSGLERSRSEPGPVIAFSLLIGCVVALIVCMVMRSKSRSVKSARSAGTYAVPEGLYLAESFDRFSHITEQRVRIESDRSSGGGHGGGTSISSGGFSHSSGKF
ncbi:MAG: TPM domain-containing protein [Oscillospiraceae bacterium]|nr:TPM domain-containing protein [Oscillospiraceae bacterium]